MFRLNWLYWFLPLIWGITALGAGRGDFQVLSASTTLINGVYLLQARLRLNLSDETLSALENGVPLTLIIDMEVGRKRRYFPWNQSIAALQQRYRLMFHSLSKQYRVTNLNTDIQESYPDLSHALRAISELIDFPLVDRRLLNSRARYEVSLRVRLDIEALPSPLRVVAYVSSGWRLMSNWYSWSLILNPAS